MRNIGDRPSSRSASIYLVSNGLKTSHITVEDYMRYPCDAYLFSRSERRDVKTKEYLRTTDKFYHSDLGIRNDQVDIRLEDLDGILENVVCNELLFRYGKVVTGAVEDRGIDFIADPEGSPRYYQVCMDIGDRDTRERELAPLIL